MKKLLLKNSFSVFDDGYIWYIAEMSGLMMKVDIKNGIASCVAEIPGMISPYQYRSLHPYKDKIYIPPYKDCILLIYDKKDGHFDKVEFRRDLLLAGCVVNENNMYFFGGEGTVVKYNVISKDIKYITFNKKEVGLSEREYPLNWFWTTGFNYKGCIYLSVGNLNSFVVIEPDDTTKYLRLGNGDRKYSNSIVRLEDDVFHSILFLESKERLRFIIGKYQIDDGQFYEKETLLNYDYSEYPFIWAVRIRDKWISFPYRSRCFSYLDNEKMEWKCFRTFDSSDFDFRDNMDVYFQNAMVFEDDLVIGINQHREELCYISLRDYSMTTNKISFEEEERLIRSTSRFINAYHDNEVRKGNILYESSNYFSLNDFIEQVERFSL